MLVDEALRRTFDLDLENIQKPAHRRAKPITKDEVAAAAERLKHMVLLDLVLPNGKNLRDATGKQCRQAGGWLVAVAERVGDRGVVGTKLSEAEVLRIFKQAK